MSGQKRLAAAGGRHIETITSYQEFAALAPAWDALWQRADGLVFQSHAWIDAWWRTATRRDDRDLVIGLVWNGAELEAVLPFATIRRRGVTVLEWAAKEHSDYGDALLAPDRNRDAVAALWWEIAATGRFDMLYLNRLLPDAAMRSIIASDITAGTLRPNHRSEISYRVAGPWQRGTDWFEAQSKKTRQNYRRGRKFMEEGGELRFRLMAPDEPLEPVLARVAALKRKWLERHGRASYLFDEGAPALAALVGVMARLGILHVFVLELAGSVVAVSINVVQRRRMMAFITTYDPEFERASPGMVLMMDYIQWSIDQGLEMVDFMCGGEDFKRRFATQSETLDSVTGARTLVGRLAMMADGAGHALRNWRSRPPASAEPADSAEPSPSHR
ncbi:acetyltransferase [Bosea sp. Root670]|uniref:GNAT family N-acetyltransferase n=1 Tax=Bosea sp. Root670 TaxID=1736583 RepID=UPI000713316C|nr:GNAT family N-acetyltransferase [Bosea sp. Root670]KRE02349.1 acetyltransferase [Bosea sp. Root670]